MDVLYEGELVSIQELNSMNLPAPPAVDGQVRSSSDIEAVLANSENAGKTYYMRDGIYSELSLVGVKPAEKITFMTYPRERAIFLDLFFGQSGRIRLDGNPLNTWRQKSASGFPDSVYGLEFRGSGTIGDGIPPVNSALAFGDTSATEWNEEFEFANFRIGDVTNEDPDLWRRQHGIAIGPHSRNFTFEDFDVGYIASDLIDMMPGGAGDFDGGGYGIWFIGGGADWGDFTFKRGQVQRCMNDFVSISGLGLNGDALFEDMLFRDIRNYGDAHADAVQNYGGVGKFEFRNCVFLRVTDWLLHGGTAGGPRIFKNCLLWNYHQVVMSKDDEAGVSDYIWDSCTLVQGANPEFRPFITGLRTDSTLGAEFVSNNQLKNCILRGIVSSSGIIPSNVYSNMDFLFMLHPNLITHDGVPFESGPGLPGDTVISGWPTFDEEGNCTSHPQGYRKSATFPWNLHLEPIDA